ncbi:MAG: ATP-binding protein [Clostridiales bacterium]|nr:ATP-binding protein [Clostridiales bacterium]MBR6254847.1 ATP-binding protein [Clostridiales bacterium]MCR5275760.1 ATP-binding protein [Clostridiales bacterium]
MEPLVRQYEIRDNDFTHAGEASSSMKKSLSRLGVKAEDIKRASIAMYEAEINAVIHGHGGMAEVTVHPDKVVIVIEDHGPGIPDLDQAMVAGWSTAPDLAREMGFGAGMGLPNIKKNCDDLKIDTKVGEGTCVTMIINFT